MCIRDRVNVPSDVILCDIPQTIALGPGETRTVTFFNAMKPSLKIIKRCEVTKDPIPNTKFHIWWASDNTSIGAMNDLGSFYTDDHGEIIFTGDALKSCLLYTSLRGTPQPQPEIHHGQAPRRKAGDPPGQLG